VAHLAVIGQPQLLAAQQLMEQQQLQIQALARQPQQLAHTLTRRPLLPLLDFPWQLRLMGKGRRISLQMWARRRAFLIRKHRQQLLALS
jgi:hypothetical protein